MKDERRRQKQLEANFEEEYFEDHGGGESTTHVNVLLLLCVFVFVYLRCICFPMSLSVFKDMG